MKKYLFTVLLIGVWSCEDTKEVESQTQFSKTFDITNFDMGMFVEQTDDGGFIILAGSDTMQTGFSNFTLPLNYSLIKTNTLGETEWIKNIYDNLDSSTFNWLPYSLVKTSDGGYLITGNISKKFNGLGEIENSSLPSSITPSYEGGFISHELSFEIVFTPVFETIKKLFLKKHTNVGTVYWEQDILNSLMEIDTNFNSIITTQIFETDDGELCLFGRIDIAYQVFKNVKIKTDFDGNIIFTKIYYDEDYYFNVQGITNDDGFIITNSEELLKMSSSGNIDWRIQNLNGAVQQTVDGGFIIIDRDDYSITITKINSSGILQWEESYNSESHYASKYIDVNQTNDGGYIFTGSSKINGWNNDIILIKTDSNGKTIDVEQ